MVKYYAVKLDSFVEYYLVDEGDAVMVSVSDVGGCSTVGTHEGIMDDVGGAEAVSVDEVPDDVVEKLEQGASNLL